jgi:predicted CXXCH cytochrome family protein
MTLHRLLRGALLPLILLPLAARAVSAPHDPSTIFNATGCEDCHRLHASTGSNLTNQPDNFTLCTNCHNNLAAGFTFGGKWTSADQAAPGAGGHSHHWSGSTTSAAAGATPPTDAGLLANAPGGALQCSTCHDPHAAAAANAPAGRHVSVATGTPLAQTGGAAAGATMTLTVGAGALPLGTRVRIGPAANQFQVSHDARRQLAAGVTWGTTYSIPGPNVAVALSHAGDDPAVSVSFSAVPTAVGGYWDWYVGFPFLRLSVGEGELCVSCHGARKQAHADVESSSTYGWATGKPFSHPVGEKLGANGRGYDLAVPLDVNGAAQGSAGRDGNATNDLVLSPAGNVTCVTCHAAHGADSNSQSVDAR